MYKIESKPYKLKGKVQHYDWGTKNETAFIPKFLGIVYEKDLAYAEYWVGVHPKAPSEVLIDDNWVSLIELLNIYPNEILGKRVAEKFSNKLPFLLKILSINHALSIQSHPDKKLAKILHEKNPDHYPDDNHKPEIAIAIDKLTAIVGLKKLEEIIATLYDYPEIESLLSVKSAQLTPSNEDEKNSKIIKEIYSEIMRAPEEKLFTCVSNLVSRIKQKGSATESEKQFLLQYEHYGVDIGLISILLFNLINLKSGDAIFTPAGIPHAYISGNIIECMANSDNVVRAGLTPKFKDIDTLLGMIETDSTKADVSKTVFQNSIVYKTNAEEFEVEEILIGKESPQKILSDEINMILVLKGKITICFAANKTADFKEGEIALIPALLEDISLDGEVDSKVYIIRVP